MWGQNSSYMSCWAGLWQPWTFLLLMTSALWEIFSFIKQSYSLYVVRQTVKKSWYFPKFYVFIYSVWNLPITERENIIFQLLCSQFIMFFNSISQFSVTYSSLISLRFSFSVAIYLLDYPNRFVLGVETVRSRRVIKTVCFLFYIKRLNHATSLIKGISSYGFYDSTPSDCL